MALATSGTLSSLEHVSAAWSAPLRPPWMLEDAYGKSTGDGEFNELLSW